MQHVPLHVELDMYDGDRDDHHVDVVQLFEMVLLIPKSHASVTKALISRELDGTVKVVRVREGGFGLAIERRDLFLISLFQHLYKKMIRNSGTGYDWWTSSVSHGLAGKLGDDEGAEINAALTRFLTPESHITEHSVTRVSRW